MYNNLHLPLTIFDNKNSFLKEITLWRKGEKSRKSQSASPHLPSHLVSAETGFPQGAAQNDPAIQQSIPEENDNPQSNDIEEAAGDSHHNAPIEGMTREEGDGEGDKEDLSPESQ